MTDQRRAELGFTDPRSFVLAEYRHGHTGVVIRGAPDPFQDDEDDDTEPRVLDLFFAGATRISCWKDFKDFEIRHPTPGELATLQGRIGDLQHDECVFLLQAGSIEHYIVAGRVYWAEFAIGAGAKSPLMSEDPAYTSDHPPIGDVILFADKDDQREPAAR